MEDVEIASTNRQDRTTVCSRAQQTEPLTVRPISCEPLSDVKINIVSSSTPLETRFNSNSRGVALMTDFRYGDRARYVLTTRISSSIWLDSLKRHSLRTDPNTHCRLLAYGYTYPHGLEKQHIDIYERHNREVRAFFQDQNAKHLLLEVCWENRHGWKPLCGFLGRGEPKEPFPHANSGSTQKPGAAEEENRRRIRQQIGLLNPS
jgi:Sulfotransferase domain